MLTCLPVLGSTHLHSLHHIACSPSLLLLPTMSSSSHNPSSASSILSVRQHGVCTGHLWKHSIPTKKSTKKKEFVYCVLQGVTLSTFCDYNAYMRGDHAMVSISNTVYMVVLFLVFLYLLICILFSLFLVKMNDQVSSDDCGCQCVE